MAARPAALRHPRRPRRGRPRPRARPAPDRAPATLGDGAVSAAHARILAAATRPLPPDTVAAGEAFLVEHARRFDPRRFATLVRRWVATVAPAAFERDTERRYDSRWLTVSPTYAGMWSVTGMLNPEAGALLHDAVDALVTTNPADDVRTRTQQRADALGELVHLAHAAAALPTTGGHRPEVVVHVTADALSGAGRTPERQVNARVQRGAPRAPRPVRELKRSSGRGWKLRK